MARRAACHVAKDPSIVPLALFEEFELMLTREAAKKDDALTKRLSMGVIKTFLTFLRSRRAPLACSVFAKNQLDSFITSFERLRDLKLAPSAYVAGASFAR